MVLGSSFCIIISLLNVIMKKSGYDINGLKCKPGTKSSRPTKIRHMSRAYAMKLLQETTKRPFDHQSQLSPSS